MSTAWIAVLVLVAAAPPEETGSTEVASSQNAPPVVATRSENPADAAAGDEAGKPSEAFRKRTGRELLAAVRETLARLARPEDEELEASVEELLFVHQELLEDEEMAGSQREYYRVKVESRLNQLSIQLNKRISRNKRLAKRKPPATIRDLEDSGEQLGQQIGGNLPPQRPMAGAGAGPGRNRMPNDDYGQQLVDLIQKTIAPSTWDVNGGLGTIYYWRPGRALVVRQTGEVHDQMGDALGQLRRAGP